MCVSQHGVLSQSSQSLHPLSVSPTDPAVSPCLTSPTPQTPPLAATGPAPHGSVKPLPLIYITPPFPMVLLSIHMRASVRNTLSDWSPPPALTLVPKGVINEPALPDHSNQSSVKLTSYQWPPSLSCEDQHTPPQSRPRLHVLLMSSSTIYLSFLASHPTPLPPYPSFVLCAVIGCWLTRPVLTDGCPGLCNNNGRCVLDHNVWHCVCQGGWRGLGCHVATETLCSDGKDNEGGETPVRPNTHLSNPTCVTCVTKYTHI